MVSNSGHLSTAGEGLLEREELTVTPLLSVSSAPTEAETPPSTALWSHDGAIPVPPSREMRFTNAHVGSDKGGTVNLRLLEPYRAGIVDLPMYTVFDATVRFKDSWQDITLVGYINRWKSTSYWGSRLIRSGAKLRVIWEEEKLGPLPGRGEPIVVELRDFTVRDNTGSEVVS